MTRRFFIFLSVLLLAACEDSATVRYKVIVQAEVDGKLVEGSSVMEVKYTAVSISALGYGGATEAKGEATVLDLGARGKLFVLPVSMVNGRLGQYYEHAIIQTVGVSGSIGSLNSKRIRQLRSQYVGQKYQLKYLLRPGNVDVLPLMVMFEDVTDPASIIHVTHDNFAVLFGGNVKLNEIYIEITDEPITVGLAEKHLPILKNRKLVWSQRPVGLPLKDLPRVKDRPFNWKIHRRYFKAKESR